MLPRVPAVVPVERAEPAGVADAPVRPARTRLAALYRGLARAGIAGLRASGHARDQVLLGETSPIGRTWGALARRPVPPRSSCGRCSACAGRLDARRAACSGRFRRLAVSGYAHHPYPRGGSRSPAGPVGARRDHDLLAAAAYRILDAGGARAADPRRLPVYYTEFGFQTNLPDRLFGVRPRRQAAYINQADWMAWRDPRVRAGGAVQASRRGTLSSFQSGLRTSTGAEAGLRRLPAADLGVRPAALRPSPAGAQRLAAGGRDLQRRRGGRFRTVKPVTVPLPPRPLRHASPPGHMAAGLGGG